MIVVKIGGSVRRLDPLLEDIAATTEQTIVVHGASRDLDDLSTRLGSPPRMVESERGDVSRFTDATTMDHFLMAYARQGEQADRRAAPAARGQRLRVDCGLDGGVVKDTRRSSLRIQRERPDQGAARQPRGKHRSVDAVLLGSLLAAGVTPVICPPIAAEDGTAINVDGDRLAAEIAVALGATLLIIFADTPGLLRDPG